MMMLVTSTGLKEKVLMTEAAMRARLEIPNAVEMTQARATEQAALTVVGDGEGNGDNDGGGR